MGGRDVCCLRKRLISPEVKEHEGVSLMLSGLWLSGRGKGRDQGFGAMTLHTNAGMLKSKMQTETAK